MTMKKDKINEEYKLKSEYPRTGGLAHDRINEHPYYDSNRRKKSEEFSTKAVALSIIGIIVIMIIATLAGCGNKEREPSIDDFLTGNEKTALDTIRSIIPNGIGTIEYPDGTVDSIRYSSDEYKMWITGEGDTIWE
jgi:hypothetical protein